MGLPHDKVAAIVERDRHREARGRSEDPPASQDPVPQPIYKENRQFDSHVGPQLTLWKIAI